MQFNIINLFRLHIFDLDFFLLYIILHYLMSKFKALQ
jgi:hypothetical protein